MEIWTPLIRDDFIRIARTSANLKGNKGPYHFNIYPKSGSVQEDVDSKRSLLSDILAKVIYTKNPKYKYMSLGLYYGLVEKIRVNPNIGHYLWRDIFVIVKGANAYMYLTKDVENFPCSDLDIMIYINPTLSDEDFGNIKRELRMIALQTISQHKRLLDNMLFVSGQNSFKESDMYKESRLFDEETIESFKKDFTQEMEKVYNTDTHKFCSPFADDVVRNQCSRYSFLLTNSEGHSDSVARIEVPHYDKCENIPLKKTPFFCSYNETIDFKRDGQNLDGKFDLYRIRFNALFVELNEETHIVKEEKVTADFIDISISSKNDAELIDFWNTARCEQVLDADAAEWKVYRNKQWETVTCWLVMPNIATCINDLYKMLNIYECPEGKKTKRQQRYKALKEYMISS